MADTPPSRQIAKILADTAALIEQLQQEPWAEYDITLQRAVVLLMKPGFHAFQRAAKSISQVRPEETRSQPIPGAEPWFGDVLDNMR